MLSEVGGAACRAPRRMTHGNLWLALVTAKQLSLRGGAGALPQIFCQCQGKDQGCTNVDL